MAGKLSFSIAINLLTENFKRGTSSVKNGLRSMQMQVLTFAAALGAGGLGLSGFVTQLITVARETSRVTTALKNVSGGMGKFADNQRFLLDMAKKYGLEINALTGNYAKFAAASQVSGMSMENQRKIFESVSRACTAFGMSADDSNGVFLALSQMMSKGKISSEELRLQMGERLPIALQAMAKAAGVSVGELDKLMKQGKLMSKDVLPGFADALNEMIPNVDTDNIETSVNRLKNAFTEFANGTGIQSAYKGIIDWLTGAVQSAGENIKNIVIGVVAVISGLIAKSVVGWWGAMASSAAGLEAVALRSNTKLIAATATRIAAEIALEEAKIAANNATGAAALAAKQRVIQAEKTLIAASAAEQVAIGNVKDAELKVLDAKRLADVKTTAGALAAITRKRVAAEIELEVAKTGVITANSDQILAAQTRLADAQTALAKQVTKEVAAQEEAKVATIQAASVKSAGWWSRACVTMRTAGAKLVVSLKTMWSAFAPMVIVSVIIGLIGYFKNLREESERVRKVFSDYKRESEGITHSPEIIQLKVIQDLYNKAADGSKLKEKYQNRIVELLGGELEKNQSINDAVRERIKLLEATAKVDFFTRKKIESEDKLKDMYNKRGGEKAFNFQFANAMDNRGVIEIGGPNPILQEFEDADNLKKIIADADANIYKNSEYVEKNKPTTVPVKPLGGNDSDKKEKKTPLQKEQSSYDKQFAELGAELEIGKITQAEYNNALGDLNIKMYAQAKGTGDKEVLESEYYKIRKETAEKAVKDQDKNTALVEFEKVQKEYNDKVKENQVQQSKGLISQKELDENIASLSLEAAKSAAGIKGIGDEADVFITAMQLNAQLLTSPIKIKPRDTTFDYKKSKTDIAGETLDKAKELADKYKEEAKSIGQTLSDEVADAMANVPSLEEALKLAEVQEDIKNFSKELDQMQWDGFKGAVSNIDGMVSAFQRLQDAFDPESEASGWERLMAVWSMMTSVVDGMVSIIKTIESITSLTDKLTRAKEDEIVVDTALTGAKVANAGIETTAEVTAIGTAATAAVAASLAKAEAASIEMAAKSTAAYASIPFLGVGFAGTQIAAMQALIMGAALPKFANGGIVSGGPSSGDKILARVNSGEMILNGGQQSRLFEAINSGRLGSSQNINIGFDRVRGTDILLSVNNTLKRQGKKTL